eukprot:m.1424310 g.1424310  ORF g.1424310 m.1424310 type:complete len:99 (-) comp25061_c0_seq12:145-441(-)
MHTHSARGVQSVQWMMATAHGTSFGEASPKTEVYCSNLPCVDYAWQNVISGTAFMKDSERYFSAFAPTAMKEGVTASNTLVEICTAKGGRGCKHVMTL